MLDFFSMLTGGGMPRYPWEMDPTAGYAPVSIEPLSGDAAPARPRALTQKEQHEADLAAGRTSIFGENPQFNSKGFVVSPDLSDTLPGQQSSAPRLTPQSGRGWKDTGRPAWFPGDAPPPAAAAAPPPAAPGPPGPVPRSLSPELYRPLDLRSTMPAGAPGQVGPDIDKTSPPGSVLPLQPPGGPPGTAAPGQPPGVTVFQGRLYNGSVRPEHYLGPAPPGTPDTPPMAQPGMPGAPARPPGPPGPAVPGVLQPKPGGIFGGLFGGMLGGGTTGPDGKELTTDQMMDRYLRMQMQRAMMPDFGKMAAAFAEAGKPSLLPTGGMGAALGKAAGAMSGGGDAKDAFAMMKIAQEIQDMRDKGAGRKAIGAKIDQFIDLVGRGKKGGGAAPAAPSAGGIPNMTAADAGGGGDDSAAVPAARGGGPTPDQMLSFASSIGASPNEATLLTSAAGAESSYNPTARHDGGIGYGLFGHNGPRLAAMRAQYGNAPGWQDQVRFALDELRSRPEGRNIDSHQTAEALTEAQMQFERPNRKINDGNFAGRLALTRKYMGAPAGAYYGGDQVASADGYPRVRIQPLSGAAAPAGGPSSADNDYEDSLALLLAQIGSQASTYGLGDTIKPLETWFYKRPEQIGRAAGAEQGAKEAAGAPYREREERLKDELKAKTERALKERQAELDRESKEQEQRRQADLTIAPYEQWPRHPQTGQKVPITVGDLGRMYGGAPAAPMAPAPMAPTMPPPGAAPLAAPAAPGGGGMGVGGALPLARPMAPTAAPGAPAAPAPGPGPARPSYDIPEQPNKEPPKDHRFKYVPEQKRWELEVIPGSETAVKQSEQDAQRMVANDTMLQRIDHVAGMVTPYNVGFFATPLAKQFNQSAKDLDTQVQAINGAALVDSINKMRQSNVTGGAMGNMSTTESEQMIKGVTALNQSDSEGAFRYNLQQVKLRYIENAYGSDAELKGLYEKGRISSQTYSGLMAAKEQARSSAAQPPARGQGPGQGSPQQAGPPPADRFTVDLTTTYGPPAAGVPEGKPAFNGKTWMMRQGNRWVGAQP